jgi:hypothetical protein
MRTTRSPNEIRAYCVIPNNAQQRAGESGHPPSLLSLIEPGSDVNIGDRPDAAPKRKSNEPWEEARPAVPIGSIGDFIIQDEVACHRQNGSNELPKIEGQRLKPLNCS